MEEGKKHPTQRNGLSASFVTGAIALVFLIIGYQAALFVHKVAVTRIAANRDHPDTVFVIDRALAEDLLAEAHLPEGTAVSRGTKNRAEAPRNTAVPSAKENQPAEDASCGASALILAEQDASSAGKIYIRKEAKHSKEVVEFREKVAPRRVESFRFNPNTASVEDLMRLGFSEKQAQAIDHYRQKGGRFRRKTDFAKSFVVADSVYARLEPYIDIPRLDINQADSTALLALPGIGPFFAGKVVRYRTQLGGYSTAEQLMDIWHFDQEKYEGLKDLITCSEPTPYPLWELPEEALAKHPYLSRAEAHGVVLYRQHNRPEDCTVAGLQKAGVLSEEHAGQLARCRISPAR